MRRNILWNDDLGSKGRAIVEALGGTWAGVGGMCRCPSHDDRSPSLSVRVGDRALLFHCFAGCETADVMRALRRAGQSGLGAVIYAGSGRPVGTSAPSMAKELWDASSVLSGTVAEAYLDRRCIKARSAELRFHPRAQLGSKAIATFHPCLVAAIRDDTGLVAVHRTFLDAKSGAKSAIADPKRMLGRPATGAVRLAPATHVLGLAEGLETALSAIDILGFPVWAVLGNERFGSVSVPLIVRRLVILPDPDRGGQRAATQAEAQAREGLSIEVMLPPRTGTTEAGDWNTVAMSRRGEEAAAV